MVSLMFFYSFVTFKIKMFIVTPAAQVHQCEILWLKDFLTEIVSIKNNTIIEEQE